MRIGGGNHEGQDAQDQYPTTPGSLAPGERMSRTAMNVPTRAQAQATTKDAKHRHAAIPHQREREIFGRAVTTAGCAAALAVLALPPDPYVSGGLMPPCCWEADCGTGVCLGFAYAVISAAPMVPANPIRATAI